MTKLIVEMEMPQACPCEFAYCEFGYYSSHGIFRPCFAWYGIPERWNEVEKCAANGTRPDWCPIKGVLPDEHGRLGDLDRLAKIVNSARIDAMQEGSDTNPYWLLGDIIAQAKTIVPATERSET